MFIFICRGYGDEDGDGDGENIFGCFWWGGVEGKDEDS